MSEHPGKKKLEELVAGLDGVTPGPWAVWEEKTPTVYEAIAEMEYQIRNSEPFAGAVYLLNANGKCPATTGCGPSSAANAAHIARCDPDTIRSISDAYKAMEAERDALRAEAGELVVAQYRISALETAITRQVKNIERWIETGEPAGPEESKSIYEQLKSALEARHEG